MSRPATADLQCSTDFRMSTKFDAGTFELIICELAECIHRGYIFMEENGEEGTQPKNDEKFVQVPGNHRLRASKIELIVLNWSALKLGSMEARPQACTNQNHDQTRTDKIGWHVRHCRRHVISCTLRLQRQVSCRLFRHLVASLRHC